VNAQTMRVAWHTRYLIQMDPPTLPKDVVADALERDMIHAGVDPTSAAGSGQQLRYDAMA